MKKPLILTDLDGTLLDLKTYSLKEAYSALTKLCDKRIPVIFVTSKTKAEVELYRSTLQLFDSPFVVENGAALYLPKTFPPPQDSRDIDPDYSVVIWGRPYHELVEELHIIASKTKVKLVGISALSDTDLSNFTGLDMKHASLAKNRQFSEPFLFAEGDTPERVKKVEEAVTIRGLYCQAGNRFYHLMGKHNKGTATEFLRNYYTHYIPPFSWNIIAIGDAPNDIPMLCKADKGFLVRTLEEAYIKNIPNLQVTKASGPAGWCEAVKSILN
jgi:mannosyl-3-phosphoglycerate phosphatase